MNGQQYYFVPQPGPPQQPELAPQGLPGMIPAPMAGMGASGIPSQAPLQVQAQAAQNNGLVSDLCKIIERQSQEIANLVQHRNHPAAQDPPAASKPEPLAGKYSLSAPSKESGEYGGEGEVRCCTPPYATPLRARVPLHLRLLALLALICRVPSRSPPQTRMSEDTTRRSRISPNRTATRSASTSSLAKASRAGWRCAAPPPASHASPAARADPSARRMHPRENSEIACRFLHPPSPPSSPPRPMASAPEPSRRRSPRRPRASTCSPSTCSNSSTMHRAEATIRLPWDILCSTRARSSGSPSGCGAIQRSRPRR